jgi:hypothetical protein
MAAAETAGPSTALRSVRDDNSVAGVGHCSVASIPATTELSSRPERSVVEGPAVSPVPTHNSHLSHLSPLVIPTGADPNFLLLLAATTCAALRRESRMIFINATTLHRKSGGA